MKDGRLHLRVDDRLLERMKKYARKRHMTLTQLVEQYFLHLLKEEEQNQAPVDAEQI